MKPVRTCVGCRQRTSKVSLRRVIVIAQELVIDDQQNLPGRGAWIHANPDCIQKANERSAFTRALRSKTQLTISSEQAETMMAKNE